jgi:hypothetical protein
MNTLELGKLVGQTGWLDEGLLQFEVRINDVKQAYGHTRYNVTPVSGKGSKWVDSDRVVLKGTKDVLQVFAKASPTVRNVLRESEDGK